MITNIRTKGFKGQDINEAIGKKTIYTGPNTTGKSSRAAAIALTILGFVPFALNPSKQGAIILSEFGTGDRMTTAIICGGVEFERTFSRSEKGTVSQLLRVDKKKFSKGDFGTELYKAGDPRIVDINDFVGMSDAKKIDTLFGLYPPDFDLKNLDSNIEKSKAAISRREESNRTALSTIKRLTESKGDIELPAGSLAETRKNIHDLTEGVKNSQKALKTAEIKIAEDNATAKANTQATADKIMEGNTAPFPDEKNHELKLENNVNSNQSFAKPDENIPKTFPPLRLSKNETVLASIQKIIDTMEKTGCQMCAAGMVAKMELRKYKGAK